MVWPRLVNSHTFVTAHTLSDWFPKYSSSFGLVFIEDYIQRSIKVFQITNNTAAGYQGQMQTLVAVSVAFCMLSLCLRGIPRCSLHANRRIGYTLMFVWCSVMAWHSIQRVFSFHTHCSAGSRSNITPMIQDNVLPENDEWMNERMYIMFYWKTPGLHSWGCNLIWKVLHLYTLCILWLILLHLLYSCKIYSHIGQKHTQKAICKSHMKVIVSQAVWVRARLSQRQPSLHWTSVCLGARASHCAVIKDNT